MIADIRRETRGHEGVRVIARHMGANLQITNGKVSLSGPKFGFIADAEVQYIDSTYEGSGYHVVLGVHRRLGHSERLQRETWWVYFHETRKTSV